MDINLFLIIFVFMSSMKGIMESNLKNITRLLQTNISKLRSLRDLETIPKKQNFHVNKIPDSQLGIEVTGLDLRESLNQEVVEFLNKETQYFGVCVFRNQGKYSAQEQIKATEYFGSKTIQSTHGVHPKSPHKHIFRLSNDDNEGINGPGPQWHHDGSFEEMLFTHFAMHIIKPSKNGNTYFSGAYDAFELLNKETQDQFSSLASVHSSSAVVHPMVFKHPKSGIMTMYLHLGWTAGIIQKINDSYRLLSDEELHDLMNFQHKFMDLIKYEHVYLEGDFVVADNMAVSHRGKENAYDRDIEKEGLRIVHRTTLKGDTTIQPEWDIGLQEGQMSKNTQALLAKQRNDNGYSEGQLKFGSTGQVWDQTRKLRN